MWLEALLETLANVKARVSSAAAAPGRLLEGAPRRISARARGLGMTLYERFRARIRPAGSGAGSGTWAPPAGGIRAQRLAKRPVAADPAARAAKCGM